MKKKKEKMKRKKKIILITLSSISLILIYLCCGAMLPFTLTPEVNKEFRDNFSTSDFYSDTISVDRASIVESSNDALDYRIKMIDEAKEKILLSSFSIRADRSCREIFSAVLAAADRGVKVDIMVDGLTGWIDMEHDPMYYVLGTHPNVEIRYYNMLNLFKPWTANGRLHDKYLIIDDKTLLLGGRNISNYFLGEYNTNVLSYDREIFVFNTAYGTEMSKQSVINEVTAYFYGIWNLKYCKTVFDSIPFYKKNAVKKAEKELITQYKTLQLERPELFIRPDYTALTVPTNKITLISNPTHIMAKEPWVWYQMKELMKNAKDRVILQTPYVVLNKDIYQDFTHITNSIPEFIVMINSIAVGDNVMASSDYTFNRKKVIKTGVQIYEFQGDHSMHNKSALIDDTISIIGSFNMDLRSTYIDTEVMLVVNGKEFNQKLAEEMNRMKEQSLLVAPDGSYVENEKVPPAIISKGRNFLYTFTSVIFQLFRYVL